MGDLAHQAKFEQLKQAVMEKRAFWSEFMGAIKRTPLGARAGEALAAAGTAAALTAAGVAGKSLFEKARDKVMKPKAFKSMVQAAPGLRKMDQQKVQMTFNTLYSMNPRMAKDPLVASSFVERHVQQAQQMGGSAGAYVDPRTVETLMGAGGKKESPIMRAFTESAVKSKVEPKGFKYGAEHVSPGVIRRRLPK